MEIKVSVIVPIYNKQEVLAICLESLVSQTMSGLQVILINDGSTDGSEQLCNEYLSKYPQLFEYHSFANDGVSLARNRGLEFAAGKYVVFIDSDDYVESNYCEKLYSKMNDADADLAFCGFWLHSQDKQPYAILPSSSNIFDNKDVGILNSPCNKMFRTDIIRQNQVFFPTGYHMGEDLYFVIKYLYYTNAVTEIREPLYNYVINDESVTTSMARQFEIFEILNLIYDFLSQKHALDKYRLEMDIICRRHISIIFAKLEETKSEQADGVGVKAVYSAINKLKFKLSIKTKIKIWSYRMRNL